jgi:hypothetical protein
MAIETPTAPFAVVGTMAAALSSNAATIDIVRFMQFLLHSIGRRLTPGYSDP